MPTATPKASPTTRLTGRGQGGGTSASAERTRYVFVEDYELIGSVGVYEHERRYEQRIVASLHLDVADTYDGYSDEIGRVWDYDKAIRAIRETIESGHFNLLETLAQRICDVCLEDECVMRVRVRLVKPDILIACRAVGIEIERDRRG